MISLQKHHDCVKKINEKGIFYATLPNTLNRLKSFGGITTFAVSFLDVNCIFYFMRHLHITNK